MRGFRVFAEQAELVAIREDVITRGKKIYSEKLKDELEPKHRGGTTPTGRAAASESQKVIRYDDFMILPGAGK